MLSGTRGFSMRRERTLLERIAATAEGERLDLSPQEDLEALADSVRRNLRRLLSSRHGLSQSAPDYGLPAFTDLVLGSRDCTETVRKAIFDSVLAYEPRLREVTVTPHRAEEESAKQTLSFVIVGKLVGRKESLSFETSPSGDGRFEVND